MKKFTIGSRLNLWYLTIFLLGEIILGVGSWMSLRQDLFDLADSTLYGQAADLQRFLEARKDTPAALLQAEIGDSYRTRHSQDFLQVTDSGGNLIYRSQFLAEHPLPPFSLDDPERPFYQSLKLGPERLRLISEQVEVNGRIYFVRIGHPMQQEFEAVIAARSNLLWLAPLLLLIAAAGGYWLNRRAANQLA